MSRYPFFIVDVFAEEKYSGNQLAVVLDAGSLEDVEMQRIAVEMNYSETTFVTGESDGIFDVRIFTPKTEIPFAGHPAIGTAYVITQEVLKEKVKMLSLNLKIGRINIEVDYLNDTPSVLWMKHPEPVFGREINFKTISGVLNIEESYLDKNYPVQEVSTGLPFLIVPLKNLEGLKKASISADRYYSLIEDLDAKGILIFCPETNISGRDLSVRVFAPYYGVAEDPATGSANGCLAAYLLKYRYFGTDFVEIKVEQGYEIGRPSLLYLRSETRGEEMDVFVGGKVVMTARGILL